MTLSFVGCSTSVNNMTPAQHLISRLKAIQGEGILFGHQDDLAYGMNWKYIDGESDVKRVLGDYPAVFGWELGGIEREDDVNLDSVPFNVMRQLAIKADKMGGINTFSWHPYSLVNGENSWYTDSIVVKHIIPGGKLHDAFKDQLNKIAEFFSSLNTKNGELIPVIFRPWHEMGGSWFWWGRNYCTPDEYKKLFRFTVEYLRDDKHLNNLIIAYSPDGGYSNASDYLTWYPGDDVVDILGVDDYEWPGTANWSQNLGKKLKILIDVAKEKDKLAILAETGAENVPDSLWFTQKLGPAILNDTVSSYLSYVLVWRNDPKVHHFFSYDGASSERDAKHFLSESNIWLLKDFNHSKSN